MGLKLLSVASGLGDIWKMMLNHEQYPEYCPPELCRQKDKKMTKEVINITPAKEQLARAPYPFPKLTIEKPISSIEDMENLCFEDFKLHNYQSHPAIKADMAI